MSRPANRMHPESGVISPASCPISVVLPAPFGPMMTWSSPSDTSSWILSEATIPWKRLNRPSTSSSAFATGILSSAVRGRCDEGCANCKACKSRPRRGPGRTPPVARAIAFAFVRCTPNVVIDLPARVQSRSEDPRLNKAERHDAGVKLIALSREATRAAEKLLADATAAVRLRVMAENHLVERLFDREQRATHGLAWLATYVESIRQLAAYTERIHAAGALRPIEELLIQI